MADGHWLYTNRDVPTFPKPTPRPPPQTVSDIPETSVLIQFVVLILNLPDAVGRGMSTLSCSAGGSVLQCLSNIGLNQVSPYLALFPRPIPDTNLLPIDYHGAAFPIGETRASPSQRSVKP